MPWVSPTSTGARAGSIEYALEEVRLAEDGSVWVPEQEDVTLQVGAQRERVSGSRATPSGQGWQQ
jgi:hypothetical protein